MSANALLAARKKMPYVRLGNSGLKISKIILGTMSYGSSKWQDWVLDEPESIEHIKFAYENGITTFDTADGYSNGLSEVVLGNAIKQLNLPREELVILTKVFAPVPPSPETDMVKERLTPLDVGVINQWGLSRKHIFDGVKASLKRLQLDYIDVLQCHRFDYNTPIEETMQALHDVVKAGYVRYIGMSSCHAYQFQYMQNYAITHNLTPFISLQNHYNLVYREEEREMFPTLKLLGVSAISWSPLARGLLTRPLNSRNDTVRGAYDVMLKGYPGAGLPEIVNRVEAIAKAKGITMAQVALAWILSKDGVSAPIVGTTNLDNLKDILGGLQVKLTPEEIQQLEEPYQAVKPFGHQ
ncbi:aryl-alcohol dehydrogenase [Irpex rosettiformis]|uniref:Aryl-alcohol dehydrogenase n=1 Tax=Irpex rosettiformis TaxID=378272 RepID=A0ACB8TNR2_9APHY|nr:aryl-alcohol dehydrogenase [Irpex rosettiformis]